MILRGRPKTDLVLSPPERGRLVTLSRQRRDPVLARRARLILRCASGQTNRSVAKAERVSARTVGKWRERFVRYRLRGLADAPRTGAPRKISDAAIGRVVQLTLAGQENAASPVSTRSLAHVCGVSRDAVHRIWRTLRLERRDGRTWPTAQGQQSAGFEAESRDVVGLLLHPLGRVLALCLEDEKNFPARVVPSADASDGATRLAGASERGIHSSRSHLALLVALEKAAEARSHPSAAQPPNHTFAGFLMRLDGSLPAGRRVRLVVSGFALHRIGEAKRWLDRHRRFDFWLIPSHLAWIALSSAWLARGASRSSDPAAYPGAQRLHGAVAAYCEPAQQAGEPFVWFAAPDVLGAMEDNSAPAEFGPALA